MNIKKGIRRIGFVFGLISGILCITLLLVHTWRGTSYQVPREPTVDEIALAKSYASQEPKFIWFRMMELDPGKVLISDRSYVEETDQWGLLAKDQYKQEEYYPYDELTLQYMKVHKGKLHSPADLDTSFVTSVYLARTSGVDPEYARTHQDELFRQEAAKYSLQELSHFPWAVEDLLTAIAGSTAIFLGIWLLPYAAYFLIKKLVRFIKEGFV